jgi:hypothetical protein
MASMGNMPNITWNEVSLCPCHKVINKNMVFCPRNKPYRVISGGGLTIIMNYIK